jgi:hypothetical protein
MNKRDQKYGVALIFLSFVLPVPVCDENIRDIEWLFDIPDM